MPKLREKSIKLTGYLRYLLERLDSCGKKFEIITPPDTDSQGCQLSLLIKDRAKDVLKALEQAGATCDFREPNIIRAAPTPMYNTFNEVWRFVKIFEKSLDVPSPSGRGLG